LNIRESYDICNDSSFAKYLGIERRKDVGFVIEYHQIAVAKTITPVILWTTD